VTAGANVGLPATADETGFVAGGTHYYRQGASLKLSYTGDKPNNYRADFSVSPDNTGATIYNQNELTVGQGDITVSVELSNVPLTDIATGTLENIPYQTYTGSPIRPAVTITVGDKELVEGTDYTLDYDSNTDLGTATVTATGQGNYTGTFTMPDDDVTVTATFIENELELADAADNTTTIDTAEGETYKVTLSGRTLYKDGDWNTLCLPFDVTLAGSPLEGATVMKLTTSTSNLTDGTLTLNFEDETTTMTAGTPYIIKWEKAEGYDAADPDTHDLKNPVFTGVTINATMNNVNTSDGKVTFLGTYDPIVWKAENKTILFLGACNTLYYPQPDLTNVDNPKYPRIKACRSYFQLNGLTAGDPAPSRFVLNFGEENTTGIVDAEANSSLFTLHSSLSGWYTIDGRKLSGKPTKPGLYINGSKMTVLKKVK